MCVIVPLQVKCVFLLRSLHRPGRARRLVYSKYGKSVYMRACVCARERESETERECVG